MAFYSQLDRMIQNDPINGVTVTKNGGGAKANGGDLAKKRPPRNKPVDGPVDTLEGPPMMMSAEDLGDPMGGQPMPQYGAMPMSPQSMAGAQAQPSPDLMQLIMRLKGMAR